MYDIDQSIRFITALTGSPYSNLTFQVFYDPKDGTKQNHLAEIWTSNLQSSVEYIDYKQSQFCGVYVTLNETDGKGREICNITKVRGLFCDFDGMVEPQWTVQPHIVQKRDETHGHAIWLVEDCDVAEFSTHQYHLALYYGTDTQVSDPARVLRLPGTVHYKNPNVPATYVVTSDCSSVIPKYKIADLMNAHMLPADKSAELSSWVEKRRGIDDGVGYIHLQSDLNRITSFLIHAAHPAVDGQGGTHELFRVAATGHDYGIPVDVMQDLMWEHYNPRCEPPWQDRERDHFNAVVQRGYYYATSAPGCKSSVSAFNSAMAFLPPDAPKFDPLNPAPVIAELPPVNVQAVYTSSEEIDRGKRLSKQQAMSLQATCTVKSSHYDFALIVDGLMYDGCGLIKYDGQFYIFNGRVWREVRSEVIRNHVLDVLSIYRPANAMISGVFALLETLVTVEGVNKDNDPDQNNVVFRNGVVNISDPDSVVNPHSAKYFTTVELPYDYDVSAQCPTWLKFLNEVFENDELSKRCLQQYFGYCLVSHNRLQKMALLVGKSRGGKGVITDTVSEMIGEANTSSPSLESLNNNSTLEAMAKSSVAFIPDAHSVHHSHSNAVVSKLKQITGQDSITYHRIYIGPTTHKFPCKIFMSTNAFPEFNDPSGALAARMLVFYFTKSFKGRENPLLRQQIKSEIAGVTQWAIRGLRDLINNGYRFTESEQSMHEKEEIRASMSPLSPFVTQFCDVDVKGCSSVKELYMLYRTWVIMDGAKFNVTMSKFRRILRTSDFNITVTDDMVYGLKAKENLLPNIGFTS